MGVAAGRVWVDEHRDPAAKGVWRLGSGLYHHVGDPPAGAALIEATIEDAYLLLLGARPEELAA